MIKRILLIGLTVLVLVSLLPVTVAQSDTGSSNSDAAVEHAAGDIVNATTEAAESTAATAQNLLNRLVEIPQSSVVRILFIVGGLILLLAGWRVYEFVVLIAGFLIGAMIATSLVVTNSAILELAILLIGGIVGAALSVFIYPVAVFLIGAYVGIALTSGLGAALSLSPVSSLVLLIGGLIGGLVLLGLSFQFLIVLSALVGAQMLTLGLNLVAVWTIIFAVLGVIVQLGLVRGLNYDYRRRPRRIHILNRASS